MNKKKLKFTININQLTINFMKKIFTLIASAFIALGANAQIQTIAGYTVTTSSVVAQDPENEAIKNRTDEGTACTVQLHATTIDTKDGINYGIKLDSETKYIQIDLNDALQAGDAVKISYFLGGTADADNTHGVQLLNLKPGTDGSKVLATMYAQIADKKDLVTKTYTAEGGEKKFFVYKLDASSSVYFSSVEVTRGSKPSSTSTLDFANPVLSSVEAIQGAIKDAVNLTIAGNPSDATQFVFKNPADKTKPASFTFVDAPISISYSNSSAKEFSKYGKDGDDNYYYQFNNTPITVFVDCAKGQYISLYPVSYGTNTDPTKVKNGKFEITNGKNIKDNSAVINIPAGTTDVATVVATEDGVTLKCTGACRITKITITDEAPTAVEAVAESKAEAKAAPVKVLKDGKLFIGNYNVAGQQVK